MDQALARFERYIKRRFGQTSTLKHYISDLNIFIDTVDNKAPEAVTAEDIDTFVDNQIAAGLSTATINRRLASMHTFFEYLASEKPERDWATYEWRQGHRSRGQALWQEAQERLARLGLDHQFERMAAEVSSFAEQEK